MNPRFTTLACGLVATAATLAASLPASANDWYQWRGPEQCGDSRETNLPDHWTPEGENVAWKAPVGGMSAPVVFNGRVYVMSRTGEVPAQDTLIPGPHTQEAYVCLDAETGKELWRHNENMTQTDNPFWRIGWGNPCGDPVTKRVYFVGSQGTFLCLDGESGKVLWKRQMTEEFGMITTFGGRTPSPAVDEDQVFVAGVSFGWGENARGQHRLYAFNKNTGELNWTSPSGGVPVDAPQNTPTIAVINGVRTVMFAGGDGGIHGFETRTGKKLWTYKASKRGMNASVICQGTRVYGCYDLDSFDTTKRGRVFCIDVAGATPARDPKLVWKIDGIEAGFPSPCLYENTLYVLDNMCVLHAIDAEKGKEKWKKVCGRIGKASPVYGDGKLYICEGNGRVTILKPGDRKAEVLDQQEAEGKLGREYDIYGSPAICNGRIYIQAANVMYCIGPKEPKKQDVPVPQLAKEEPVGQGAKVTQLVVTPADIVLRPGQKATFAARGYDDKGRLVKSYTPDEVKWSIGQLTMPAAPAPPAGPTAKPAEIPREAPKPTGASGRAPSSPDGSARVVLAADAPAPTTPGSRSGQTGGAMTASAGQKIGNLKGNIDGGGTFTAENGPFQGGAIDASADGASGFARVRVLPNLPWKMDFEQVPVGSPPLTWLGAGGKFAVQDLQGNKVLVKLIDPPGHESIPPKALYARARTNFGAVDMHDYTVQADVRATEIISGENKIRKMPNAGIIDSRYVLELRGPDQEMVLFVWPTALWYSVHARAPLTWQANKFYRLKLRVEQAGDKAIAMGKVWPADGQEPADWAVKLEDPTPNRNGNPGLWGFSNENEIYYDNIVVTDNKAQ